MLLPGTETLEGTPISPELGSGGGGLLVFLGALMAAEAGLLWLIPDVWAETLPEWLVRGGRHVIAAACGYQTLRAWQKRKPGTTEEGYDSG